MKRIFNGLLAGALLASASLANAEDIQQFIINGQSLSTGDQSWPPLSTENVPGNYMLGDEVWINAGLGYQHNYFQGANWDLHPLVASKSRSMPDQNLQKTRGQGAICESAVVGAVNHLQKSYLNGKKLLATSVGVSGSTVEQLSKERDLGNVKEFENHHYYTHFLNMLDEAKKTTVTSGAYDHIVCPAIFWMQGEFNYAVKRDGNKPWLHFGLNPDEDNCTDTKTYKARMLKLKENMQNDIKAAYGQSEAPLWITYQTGGQYVRDNLQIGMAQLQAANENADVIMAGSPYPCTDRGGHLDANGYRWFGEMLAKAYVKHAQGKDVTALQPRKISREGNVVRVEFYVAEGNGPLVFDTNLLPEIENYGFNVYLNGYRGASRQTITDIKIEGNTVVLTCEKNLDGGKVVVTYGDPEACVKNKVADKNNLNGHGNLRDSDPYQSQLTYIDLDKKDANGKFVYPRDHMKGGNGDFLSSATEDDEFTADDTLRPNWEPKDESGNVIYDKPYPLYNFAVSFYYTLNKRTPELQILDENGKPLTSANQQGDLEVAYVDAENGDDANAGSEAAPFKTLAKAAAAVKWDGATVYVKGTVNVPEDLILDDYVSLTIEGVGDNATLDGEGKSYLAETENMNVTLKNLTFTDFYAAASGGVLNMNGGNLTVEDCTFDGNRTSCFLQANGGVFNVKNCNEVKIDGCEFTNNEGWHGAVLCTTDSKSVVINNSNFDRNTSKINDKVTEGNKEARGVIASFSSNIDIDNCRFTNNLAKNNQCGVFYVQNGSGTPDQHFTVKNSDILDNSTNGDHGGVMSAMNGGQRNFEFNFINCTIAGNKSGGVGSVFWMVEGDNDVVPTQTLNIYNCTITGNTPKNKYNSTIVLWKSRMKTNIVNTILEGNYTWENEKGEYSDLHCGDFLKRDNRDRNVNIKHSVVGRFIKEQLDSKYKNENPVPELAEKPAVDEVSKFDLAPNSTKEGSANQAGILGRGERDEYQFAGKESFGVELEGSDDLLKEKFGITTDRFGHTRSHNCIGSVELAKDYLTDVKVMTSEDSALTLSREGSVLRVSSALFGEGVTLEVFSVEGLSLLSQPLSEGQATLDVAAIGSGIRVLRVASASASRTLLFAL